MITAWPGREVSNLDGLVDRPVRFSTEVKRVNRTHVHCCRVGGVPLGMQTSALGEVGRQDLLRVELLGPVRVMCAGAEVGLGPARQRSVFAVLATRAGQTVSRAELVEAVWGQSPPASADNN